MDQGFFLGFVGSPREFFGFSLLPHSIIPVTRNPEYPPPGLIDARAAPERRPTFEKVIDLHCKNENFAEESTYFRLTILFCFCDN